MLEEDNEQEKNEKCNKCKQSLTEESMICDICDLLCCNKCLIIDKRLFNLLNSRTCISQHLMTVCPKCTKSTYKK